MKAWYQLPEWQALLAHHNQIASVRMQTWFDQDAMRFSNFSLSFNGLLLDFSKNRINHETIGLLLNWANALHLKDKINQLFSGHPINYSENRAALHTALRSPSSAVIIHRGENIIPGIHAALDQMRVFSNAVRNRRWLGQTGKPISSIVSIGVGGSHLGPLMATHALKQYAHPDLTCHYVSNIDSAHLNEVLQQIDPETTLFIVSSKSFTTLETMTHAKTLREWIKEKLGHDAIAKHFVAVTAAKKAALEFGIPAESIFPLWDWVGGRYSVWSAIGLPLALMIGMDAFLELLAGGHAMDEHFRSADFSENMPVIMALLGIWYIHFFQSSHHAIVPYSHHLHYLRMHLQQLDMESNGKSVSQQGEVLEGLTGPVILGEQGCNGQHAFHQLLHQGSHFIPVDFILVGADDHDLFKHHHDILISSGLSQAQALMRGKTLAEAMTELEQADLSDADRVCLANQKVLAGNRPSNTLFLDKMTPFNLGMLLALYEHKTFVQGVMWGINSFDQWGVELGKSLLPHILHQLQSDDSTNELDASTQGLIHYYKQLRNSK